MLNGSLLKQVGAFAQDTWNNYVIPFWLKTQRFQIILTGLK